MTTGSLIFSPTVFLIHCPHLSLQLPILILKLSDHPIQPFHNGRLGNIVHLIPILLIMSVVLVGLVVLVVLIVLFFTNMLSHVHTLTPCGNHSPCMRIVSGPTVGTNVLTCFLRSSDVVLCKYELLHASPVANLQGALTLKSKLHSTQVQVKGINYLPLTLRSLFLYLSSNSYSPIPQ